MSKSAAGFPERGELFEGRYRIESIIGRGGFARVYRAKQEDLGRDVAIKILIPSEIEGDNAAYPTKLMRRFNQEAKLVSRLQDPHTITMYDYGRTDTGMLYMVFEFVDGESISELVEREGALHYTRVLSIVEQTLGSLEEAHAFGVMHRDIKPGNIMVFDHVGRADQVKLLDFGIAKVAKATGSQSKDLTADGTLVGTPRYMSPEQIRGEEITPRSDIYSLGLVAYEMLVGTKAIEASSSVTIIGLQLDPTPFRIPVESGVPAGIRYIVDKMMTKNPKFRYQTTAEALADIRKWETLQPPPGMDAQRISEDSLPMLSPPSFDSESKRISPMFVGLGLALIILIAGVAIAISMATKNAQSEDQPVAELKDEPNHIAAIVDQSQKEEEPNELTIVKKIEIRSEPSGVPVLINGVAYGSTPIFVPEDRVIFPAQIELELNGKTRKKTLAAFEPEIQIDLKDLVVAAKSPIATKKKPLKKLRKPKRIKSPKKPQPDPAPEPSEAKFKKKPVFVPMDVNQ